MKSSNTGKCVYACSQADNKTYNSPNGKTLCGWFANHIKSENAKLIGPSQWVSHVIQTTRKDQGKKKKKIEMKMKSPNQLKDSSMGGYPLDHLLLLPTFVLQPTLAHFRSTAQID